MTKADTEIDAFWFAAGDRLRHGDNRPIILGETHSVSGEIVLCKNALHASRDSFGALQYAPGPYLYKVRCWGDVIEDNGKLGARNREYVDMHDATTMLRQFAREQALSVIHLWDAPEVVRRYLETGSEALRLDASTAIGEDCIPGNAVTSAARLAASFSTDTAATGAARESTSAMAAAMWAIRNNAIYAAWSATLTNGFTTKPTWEAARARFGELTDALFAAPRQCSP